MPRTDLNSFGDSNCWKLTSYGGCCAISEIGLSHWFLVLVSMTAISLVNDLSGLLTNSGDVSSVETI